MGTRKTHKFTVSLVRRVHETAEVEVEATSQRAAKKAALEAAGSLRWEFANTAWRGPEVRGITQDD